MCGRTTENCPRVWSSLFRLSVCVLPAAAGENTRLLRRYSLSAINHSGIICHVKIHLLIMNARPQYEISGHCTTGLINGGQFQRGAVGLRVFPSALALPVICLVCCWQQVSSLSCDTFKDQCVVKPEVGVGMEGKSVLEWLRDLSSCQGMRSRYIMIVTFDLHVCVKLYMNEGITT